MRHLVLAPLLIATGLAAAQSQRQVSDPSASTSKSSPADEASQRLKTDGNRILPRLLSPAYVEQFPWMVHKPLANTGLEVAYVVDSEEAVRYLSPQNLREMGLDMASLHKLALANLARTLPRKEIRQALSKKQVVTIQRMDSFDATRLLLVPGALKPGEALAAVVPDRDALYLAPVPADGNWEPLRELAQAADGPPLLNRPLKVTPEGFEKM